MEIIEMITAITSLLVAIATSAIAILTKLKAVKNIEAAEKVTNELISLQSIADKINEYAIIAEANGGTSEEKKQFVLNSIEAISEEYDWTYDEEWVSDTLEAIIAVTKKINSK